ncbi:MAG: hypothetical protein K0Q99_2067 [Clostridia bacterium]|jgi:hypothetical protein|nr:hypothetical protein [Clostridia bacterium]
MNKKIQYITQEERLNKISENPGFRILEEQNLLEGNFLILTDEPAPTQEVISIYQDISHEELNNLAVRIEGIENTTDILLLKQEGIL